MYILRFSMISQGRIRLSEKEVHGYALNPFDRVGRTADINTEICYVVDTILNEATNRIDYILSTEIGPIERIDRFDHKYELISAARLERLQLTDDDI